MSLTSSALTVCSTSSPTFDRRSSAAENCCGRTLKVSVVCAMPCVLVSWENTKPPSPSMIELACAAAAATSAVSTAIHAV